MIERRLFEIEHCFNAAQEEPSSLSNTARAQLDARMKLYAPPTGLVSGRELHCTRVMFRKWEITTMSPSFGLCVKSFVKLNATKLPYYIPNAALLCHRLPGEGTKHSSKLPTPTVRSKLGLLLQKWETQRTLPKFQNWYIPATYHRFHSRTRTPPHNRRSRHTETELEPPDLKPSRGT